MSTPDKILVFSQTATKRVFVGTLRRSEGQFRFEYDKAYRRMKGAVALGPEFELWKESFESKPLFPSIADRIPSPQNPAYADYCRQWGIPEGEKDVFVLLTTIGRRGPSTFIFEPAPPEYTTEMLKAFREKLGLSQREFATLFGIMQSTLVKLEAGKQGNPITMRFIQLCDDTPVALKWLIEQRGKFLHDDKGEAIRKLIGAT
ncbi:MAG: HipA N-terminal domain-containing protein [Pseudomonadota bacterium]